MKYNSTISIIVSAASLLHLSCAIGPAKMDLTQYQGDGVVEDTSQSGGAKPTSGYVVMFPSFDLGQSYTNTFHIKRFPDMPQRPVGIYLLIDESIQQNDLGTIEANITLEVLNNEGKLLKSAAGGLKDFVWATPVHGRRGHALYRPRDSFFNPESNSEYYIRATYTSGRTQTKGHAQIYIWCSVGGS